MICSSKERETCNVEKMRCEGCAYYDGISLEDVLEGKECLREIISNTYAEGKAKKLNNVLKYLNNLEQQIDDLKTQRDYYKARYLEFNNAFIQGGRKLTEE